MKMREAGRVVSVAVTIAVAVNDRGRREVLGMAIGASEAETFWTSFLRSLARRGLRGVMPNFNSGFQKYSISQGVTPVLPGVPTTFW